MPHAENVLLVGLVAEEDGSEGGTADKPKVFAQRAGYIAIFEAGSVSEFVGACGASVQNAAIFVSQVALTDTACRVIRELHPCYVVVFGARIEDIEDARGMFAGTGLDVRVMADHGDGRHSSEVVRAIIHTAEEVYGCSDD